MDPPEELLVLIVKGEALLNTVGTVPPTVKLFARMVVADGPIVREEGPPVIVTSANRTDEPILPFKVTVPVVLAVRVKFSNPGVEPSIVLPNEMDPPAAPLVLITVEPVMAAGEAVVIVKLLAVILPLIFTAFEVVAALVTVRFPSGVIDPIAPPNVTVPPVPAKIVRLCV